jgi:hypothetical protein
MSLTSGSLTADFFITPFSSEPITYSLMGVEHKGRKIFTQDKTGYSEVIRDLQGNAVVGAIEVSPTQAVPNAYNQIGFIDLQTIGGMQVLTNAHSFSIITDGSVDVNGKVFDNSEAISLTATTTFPSITITALAGKTIGYYTY